MAAAAAAIGPAIASLCPEEPARREEGPCAADLGGPSAAMAELRRQVSRAASAPFPVLVLDGHGGGGTFLPQVATETGWTLEEFLGHCARDKAGIGWEGWKNAEIFIYEAYVFGE